MSVLDLFTVKKDIIYPKLSVPSSICDCVRSHVFLFCSNLSNARLQIHRVLYLTEFIFWNLTQKQLPFFPNVERTEDNKTRPAFICEPYNEPQLWLAPFGYVHGAILLSTSLIVSTVLLYYFAVIVSSLKPSVVIQGRTNALRHFQSRRAADWLVSPLASGILGWSESVLRL